MRTSPLKSLKIIAKVSKKPRKDSSSSLIASVGTISFGKDFLIFPFSNSQGSHFSAFLMPITVMRCYSFIKICPNESVLELLPQHAFKREVFGEEHPFLRHLLALDHGFDQKPVLSHQLGKFCQTKMRFVEHHRAALVEIICRVEINGPVVVILVGREYEGVKHGDDKPTVRP